MNQTHLSPQHELFAQEVAMHGNQTKAYRVAYPKAQAWKDATVWSKASILAADDKVMARISKLRAEVEKQLGISRVDWLDRLAQIALNDTIHTMTRLRALAEYGKAQGYFVPDKCNITSTVEAVTVTPEERWERICGIFGVDPATTPRRNTGFQDRAEPQQG